MNFKQHPVHPDYIGNPFWAISRKNRCLRTPLVLLASSSRRWLEDPEHGIASSQSFAYCVLLLQWAELISNINKRNRWKDKIYRNTQLLGGIEGTSRDHGVQPPCVHGFYSAQLCVGVRGNKYYCHLWGITDIFRHFAFKHFFVLLVSLKRGYKPYHFCQLMKKNTWAQKQDY